MDDTTSGTPQAGETDNLQPQAGNTPTTPEPQAGDGQEAISLEEARKLRSEAANLRKRLKAFEEADAKAKDAQLSEQQRLQKQYDELKTQHEEYTQAQLERMVNYEVRLQAASLGVNPKHLDKVSRLIEWEELNIDEDTGSVTNVRETLEKLLKDMPELLSKGAQTPTSGGGATNPSRSQSNAPAQLSWDVLSNMTPDEYNRRRAEIQQWMLSNPPRFR